jgi:hypothetical protein
MISGSLGAGISMPLTWSLLLALFYCLENCTSRPRLAPCGLLFSLYISWNNACGKDWGSIPPGSYINDGGSIPPDREIQFLSFFFPLGIFWVIIIFPLAVVGMYILRYSYLRNYSPTTYLE